MRTAYKCLFALVLTALGAAGSALADGGYPSKPVTIIVPYATGGASDFAARMLGVELGKRFGQPVIVENVAGAGGAIGVQRVARSSPDGYTLLYGSLSEVVLVPLINPAAAYKSEDLLPVAFAGSTPIAVLARPGFPANTMDELFTLARNQPDKITYGSPGIGTFQHMVTESIATRAKVKLVHIPYKGGGQIITDLTGGQIDIGITSVPNVIGLVTSGRAKVLGVSSAARVPALKSAQSFDETAVLKGIDYSTWGMVFAPPGIPQPILANLNTTINAVLQLPAMREAREKAGAELAAPLTPAQARSFVAAEKEKFRAIAATVKPE